MDENDNLVLSSLKQCYQSVDEKYYVEQYVEQTFEIEYGNNTEAEARALPVIQNSVPVLL